MKQQIPWEQLVKYFAGELTREENREMESWISANPQREEQVGKLYEIWQESGTLPYQLDVDEGWGKLEKGMNELEKQEQRIKHHQEADRRNQRKSFQPYDYGRKPQSRSPKRFIIAAAAVILMAVGLYVYNGSYENSKNTPVGVREIVANQGERATYILNDSSKIVLHAGSRIEVPTNFNIDSRELYLEGEAYFEVTANPDKPFIVHSEETYTKVLGTKFLVQAWSGVRKKLEVVVSEGKVALGTEKRPTGEEAIVTRNQKGVLSGDQEPVIYDNVDLDWYLGWTQGRLIFNNRPLSEIIPKLERWYDIDIKTATREIASQKLTAEIDYSQSMREVVQNIALSLGLSVGKEGDTITFS
ncbi:FecR family protein [Fodinibius salsisoli]|uniref:FecR domain-containing protein n=1 Tax=Fodinibius salsisoli TaxID=2820877 RepID=A0ABT3PQ42_9BACT|nr:FecR domain-containing protein [Fodinibius salsisoli]MCW9707975.1 FecR domain-containing protein [Fodinibius salsisoli]